ncbi:MAG: acyl-CoA dehydrogenase family protein [Chloroflexota bacterium]
MDFTFTAEEAALRHEVGEFAKRELPPDIKGGISDYEEQFHGRFWEAARTVMPKVGARGWLAPGWPVEYGGKGAPATTQMLCQEELAYWGIPGADMGIGGISWIGPGLLNFGSEEQKREHLPPLARGEQFWCTAYSEPGSGSDMASMQSRAVRKGDDYVINGQKVWTSAGHVSDWCWLLVRTNPDVAKHRGLSLFLLDLRSKGVSVRPIPAMSGIAPFAEMFFDDVHVPRRNLVGEEDKGWNHVVGALEYERASVGLLFAGLLRRLLDELVKLTGAAGSIAMARNSLARHKLAELAVEVEVSRVLAYRAFLLLASRKPSNAESAISKLFSTELSQKAAQVSMELVGLHGQLAADSPRAVLGGRVFSAYISCMGNTILAGTSEIERNVVAQRGLGLPR